MFGARKSDKESLLLGVGGIHLPRVSWHLLFKFEALIFNVSKNPAVRQETKFNAEKNGLDV